MAYFKARVGGNEKGAIPDLLWTNPNPTSAFAAQTIPLDIDTYKYFIIDYKVCKDDDNDVLPFYIDASGDYDAVFARAVYMGGFRKGVYSSYRRVNIVRNGTKGLSFDSASSSGSSNGYAYPIRIYGFKNPIFEESSQNLLWENPSPTSAFEPTTINIDLQEYSYFIIKFDYYAGQTDDEYLYYLDAKTIDYQDNTNSSIIRIHGIHTSNYLCYRSLYFVRTDQAGVSSKSTTGIYFGSASRIGGSTQNAYMVPLKIYGFKKPLYTRPQN